MKLKKNKYKFSAPEKYKTGEAFANVPTYPADIAPELLGKSGSSIEITAEKADWMLKTVELSRAEIDRALSASQGAGNPVSSSERIPTDKGSPVSPESCAQPSVV
ncbi:MAG: hypothetical protein RSD08_02315, partial [Oscillospiraceae bacterium]